MKTTAPRIRADSTPSSQPQHAPDVSLSLSLSLSLTQTHTHTHTHTRVGGPVVARHFKTFSQRQALLFWRAHPTPYKAY